jgi:thioredoxin reductase
MSRTLIIGDGPAGLSAGLLLSKRGEEAHVFGKDTTKMHSAYIYNYLGIKQISGTEFIRTAREQCQYFGANIHDTKIQDVSNPDEGFKVGNESGKEWVGDYLIIATGHFSRGLFSSLGVETDNSGRIEIDSDSRTNVDGVYAVGVATRTQKVQAAISVGQGAAAAVDIISKEQDEVPHDFDTKSQYINL